MTGHRHCSVNWGIRTARKLWGLLPNLVYAAELGYNYDGEEYWQSFENRTPGWSARGDREWIRSCFFRFQKEFLGAIPTGRWADHFSIICWPITHAILPLDLQRQLAQNLYEMRYALSPDPAPVPRTARAANRNRRLEIQFPFQESCTTADPLGSDRNGAASKRRAEPAQPDFVIVPTSDRRGLRRRKAGTGMAAPCTRGCACQLTWGGKARGSPTRGGNTFRR